MQKRYSKDFKETIVDLYQTGQSVAHLAKEYGISPATIYKWIDLYSKPNDNAISKSDYLELKRQLAQVKEERDILKKVLTIFAEELEFWSGFRPEKIKKWNSEMS